MTKLLTLISVHVDMDECENPSTTNCPTIATCQNTYGSFRCQCPQGQHVKDGVCIGK